MLTPTNDSENVPLNTPLIPQTGIRTPVRMMVPQPGTVSRPLIVREEPIRLSDGVSIIVCIHFNRYFVSAIVLH